MKVKPLKFRPIYPCGVQLHSYTCWCVHHVCFDPSVALPRCPVYVSELRRVAVLCSAAHLSVCVYSGGPTTGVCIPTSRQSILTVQKIWISPCIWPHVNQMSRISRISKKHNRCSLYKDSTNDKSNKNLWFLLSSVNFVFSIAKKENKQVIKHIIYHSGCALSINIKCVYILTLVKYCFSTLKNSRWVKIS